MTVAALFVDPNGVYAGLPDVEVWDEARDARLYDGPWPVVAHPPCQRWSIMAQCRAQRDGDDGGCFEAALRAVERFGGVLEHPAHSLAWSTFQLPRPSAVGGWVAAMWGRPGWSCQVDQGRYGYHVDQHAVRKPTWIYYVGDDPPALDWLPLPKQARRVGRIGGGGNHRRSGTPEAFRDVLLEMARSARVRSLA